MQLIPKLPGIIADQKTLSPLNKKTTRQNRRYGNILRRRGLECLWISGGGEFLIAVLLSILSGFALGNLITAYKGQEEDDNIKKGKK